MSLRPVNAGDTAATAVYDATLTDVADILDAPAAPLPTL